MDLGPTKATWENCLANCTIVRMDGIIKVQRLRKSVATLTEKECLQLLPEYGSFQGGIRDYLQELVNTGVLDAGSFPKRGFLPTKAYEDDAGWDLYSDIDVDIPPWWYAKIATGIAVEIPPGYCAVVCDRSSMGGKGVHRLAGVMDSGYRDEWHMVLLNCNAVAYHITRGDKIAQALILPVPRFQLVEADTLGPSHRGTRGFGSSGT